VKRCWLTFAALLCSLAVCAVVTAQEDEHAELWGGRDIALRMTAVGASIEFDCGHGNITQPIRPDATGAFTAIGTYSPERGGPVRRDNPSQDLPATYKGTISGDTMHLEISLEDKTRQPPPFTLTRGNPGRLVKCR